MTSHSQLWYVKPYCAGRTFAEDGYSWLCVGLQIAFTIWDVYGPRKAMPVGSTVIPAFNKHGLADDVFLSRWWIVIARV